MICFKLFRKMKDGSIKSLFINKKVSLPTNEWLEAVEYPTSGFQVRKGWHCCPEPKADHLSKKNRVWQKVQIENYTEISRPVQQGKTWYLANRIKILGDIDE